MKIVATALLVLLTGCAAKEPERKTGWTPQALSDTQAYCRGEIQGKAQVANQEESMCSCWVDEISYQYAYAEVEAPPDPVIDDLNSRLNRCGDKFGGLRLLTGLFSRDPLQEPKVPGGIKETFKRRKQAAAHAATPATPATPPLPGTGVATGTRPDAETKADPAEKSSTRLTFTESIKEIEWVNPGIPRDGLPKPSVTKTESAFEIASCKRSPAGPDKYFLEIALATPFDKKKGQWTTTIEIIDYKADQHHYSLTGPFSPGLGTGDRVIFSASSPKGTKSEVHYAQAGGLVAGTTDSYIEVTNLTIKGGKVTGNLSAKKLRGKRMREVSGLPVIETIELDISGQFSCKLKE